MGIVEDLNHERSRKDRIIQKLMIENQLVMLEALRDGLSSSMTTAQTIRTQIDATKIVLRQL